MNSPIDSQRTHPSRTDLPPNGRDREQGKGSGRPRNALLSSQEATQPVIQSASPEGQAPSKGPPTELPRASQDGTISARAFERFKRTSTFAPRTAFLTSPAVGPRHREAAAEAAPQGAPIAPATGAQKGQYELDPNEPLLSEEEINAFFSMPLPVIEGTEANDAAAETAAETAVEKSLEGSLSEALEQADAEAASTEAQRPAWLKNQVADLADLVQALDLQARAHHAHVGLETELSRLRQFTRTMGLVASPPPKGLQEFDIATLVEEALGAIAGATPNAPRILFRKRGDRTETTADKVLVAAAIDALLQTAVACAGSGDVVRITVEGRAGEPIVTEIEFPPGPLAELHPDRILTPYALRKILPNIGPNALAAAGAIAVGQGGDMSLTRGEDGTATFLFELQGPLRATRD